jgi:hypothetical protein
VLCVSFEKELLKKLSQKASGVQSEEAVLMKCFKYFDLNNNGTVEPEEFAKAIEKIGIMIPTRQVSFRTRRAKSAATFKLYYRTWTPSMVSMTQITLEPSTTKSSPNSSTAATSPQEHQQETRPLLTSLLTVFAKSSPQEERVALLV